jgi:hypothetical protein
MTARRASRHACAKGEVSLLETNVTPLWGPRHTASAPRLVLIPPSVWRNSPKSLICRGPRPPAVPGLSSPALPRTKVRNGFAHTLAGPHATFCALEGNLLRPRATRQISSINQVCCVRRRTLPAPARAPREARRAPGLPGHGAARSAGRPRPACRCQSSTRGSPRQRGQGSRYSHRL